MVCEERRLSKRAKLRIPRRPYTTGHQKPLTFWTWNWGRGEQHRIKVFLISGSRASWQFRLGSEESGLCDRHEELTRGPKPGARSASPRPSDRLRFCPVLSQTHAHLLQGCCPALNSSYHPPRLYCHHSACFVSFVKNNRLLQVRRVLRRCKPRQTNETSPTDLQRQHQQQSPHP